MKKYLNNLIEFINNHLIEIFIILGLFLIVLATALINVIAGIYVLGTAFLLLAITLFNLTRKG